MRKKKVEKLHKDLETKKLMQELSAMRNVSDEKRLQIKFEWEFCIEQIKWGLADSDWEKFTELEDIQGMILTLETQMENMCKACGELKGVYGRDVGELGFISINADIINSIRERIQQGKQRIKSIKNEKALFQEALLEKQAK